MLSVGVTGSFGTGKTTVARMLARYGAKVLDADKIAHQLLKRRGPCFKAVVARYGKDILTKGRIDRRKLGRVVFDDPKKLKNLEKVIHPFIIKEIKFNLRRLAHSKRKGIVVVDVPLLFEAGLHRMVDKVIVVKANRATQIQRLVKRTGMKRNDIIKRIEIQMPIRHKIRRADFVIDNGGSLAQTRKQVKMIWRKLKDII